MAYRIEHEGKINRTPAIRLGVKAWAELLERDLVEDVCLLHWDSSAFIVYDDGALDASDERAKAIGTLIYKDNDWLKEYWIAMAYVEPSYRKLGVYRALWNALVARAMEKKVPFISGDTAMGNLEMRATAAALGRTERAVVLKYKVPCGSVNGAAFG